jgi:hypothetical protein
MSEGIGTDSNPSVIIQLSQLLAPKQMLTYPDTLLEPTDPLRKSISSIQRALQSLLRNQLEREPKINPTASDNRVYYWDLDFTISNQSLKVFDGLILEALTIPITIQCGEICKQYNILLTIPHNEFPGWIAIDFGTSNSTVAIHDEWENKLTRGSSDEQDKALRKKIRDWFVLQNDMGKRPPEDTNAQWESWRRQIIGDFGAASDKELAAQLNSDELAIYRLIHKIEILAVYCDELLQRYVYTHLNKLYREVLQEAPLQRFGLFRLNLNLDTKSPTITSDIEIRDPTRSPIDILMGSQVYQNRGSAISSNTELEKILQRFLPSPKRYFGTTHAGFTVDTGKKPVDIKVEQLMQAG